MEGDAHFFVLSLVYLVLCEGVLSRHVSCMLSLFPILCIAPTPPPLSLPLSLPTFRHVPLT